MPGHRRHPLRLGIAPASGSRPERMLVDSPAYFGGRHRHGSTGRRLLVQKEDSSRLADGWWRVSISAAGEVDGQCGLLHCGSRSYRGPHTWYLASDTPSMLMNNVACAVNGEQGILAWTGMAGFGCIPRRATALPMRYICAMIFGFQSLGIHSSNPAIQIKETNLLQLGVCPFISLKDCRKEIDHLLCYSTYK